MMNPKLAELLIFIMFTLYIALDIKKHQKNNENISAKINYINYVMLFVAIITIIKSLYEIMMKYLS